MEDTLVLIKPDAVQRGLIGNITARLENRGLKLIAMKMIKVDQDLAGKHYAVHAGKPFYSGLIQYITSAPVVAMVWQGPNAIKAVRQTMGATNPTESAPGTVRHDYALTIGRNLTHASDGVETARNEIALWFTNQEIVEWERLIDSWVFETN